MEDSYLIYMTEDFVAVDSVPVFMRKFPRKIIRPLKTFKQELQSERQIRVIHRVRKFIYIANTCYI